jgi:hypothetical protein
MKAYFFTVRQSLPDCIFDIKELYVQFGQNIPMYLPLEGHASYLFYVAMDPHEILNICRKNNCEISGYSDDEEEQYKEMFLRRAVCEKDISNEKYSSQYIATINYTGEGYVLEPLSQYR